MGLKNLFFERLGSRAIFFLISKYLIEKYVDIDWWYQLPGTPKWTTKNQFFFNDLG